MQNWIAKVLKVYICLMDVDFVASVVGIIIIIMNNFFLFLFCVFEVIRPSNFMYFSSCINTYRISYCFIRAFLITGNNAISGISKIFKTVSRLIQYKQFYDWFTSNRTNQNTEKMIYIVLKHDIQMLESTKVSTHTCENKSLALDSAGVFH